VRQLFQTPPCRWLQLDVTIWSTSSPTPDGGEGDWLLHVLDMRDKAREVPMPHALIDKLPIYLARIGLATLPCLPLAIEKDTFLVIAYP
jgi:hypothetical protein